MQKIDAALRDAYETQRRVAADLQTEVDRDLRNRKKNSWHYESRVKELESFAQKVETGRTESIHEIEDIFGATIVVPVFALVEEAVELVVSRYDLEARRPLAHANTTKRPESFQFDDVRLYVRYRRSEGEQTAIPNGALFEVQVKTFLQHAWAVATHDVIYKSPSRDWRRERIAFQVRAALEAAEVAIADVEALAGSPVLPQTSTELNEINGIIELIHANWDAILLPINVRRLAENLRELLIIASRGERGADKVAILKSLLDQGRDQNGGQHSVDWSPYRSVLHYLAISLTAKLRGELSNGRRKNRLLIYPETLETLELNERDAPSGLLVK